MSSDWRISVYKYRVLVCGYLFFTGLAVYRVYRRPYTRSVKAEQIETIFKATTLGAVVLGIGISGNINRPRSFSAKDK